MGGRLDHAGPDEERQGRAAADGQVPESDAMHRAILARPVTEVRDPSTSLRVVPSNVEGRGTEACRLRGHRLCALAGHRSSTACSGTGAAHVNLELRSLHLQLYSVLLVSMGGLDEARKQRVRRKRLRLELRVELHGDEPGM